jgi:hypothetical protein
LLIALVGLLVLPVSPVLAQDVNQCVDFADRSTESPLWCRHTVLIYVNPSGAKADFWTRDRFEWVAAYRDQKGQHKALFFDGFLFIGFSCKGGRHLLPLTNRKPAIKSDWEDALNNYMAAVEKLSQSFEDVARFLEKADARRAADENLLVGRASSLPFAANSQAGSLRHGTKPTAARQTQEVPAGRDASRFRIR